MTFYRIYVRNQTDEPWNFWCFLAPPGGLGNDPGVFANSAASSQVGGHGLGNFTVTGRYFVGAGAGDRSVGGDVEIEWGMVQGAGSGETWKADYANVPPQRSPMLSRAASGAPPSISLVSNAFDKASNERAGSFANQSFGVETSAGYTGMTWSPDPGQTRIFTPKLTMLIAAGSFGSNRLTSWNPIFRKCAVIDLENLGQNQCTATLTPWGEWEVAPGPPDRNSVSGDTVPERWPEA